MLLLRILLFVLVLTGCSKSESPPKKPSPAPEPTPEPIPSNSIRIAWITPSIRANGDPLSLSEIGGYKLYVTTNPFWIPPDPIDIPSTETNYTINNLSPGTYYFYFTTYDTNNDESDYASLSTTIN